MKIASATVLVLASACSLHVPLRPPTPLSRPLLTSPKLRAASPPRASFLTGTAETLHSRSTAKPRLALGPPLRSAAANTRSVPPQASLLAEAASDQWLLYTVLTSAAATGYRLGVSTKLGKLATGPICAMGLTFVAAGTGVLPPASAPVSAAQGLAVRLATPLLLFGANLGAIASRAGRLMPAFALGCLGTVLGTLAGWAALRGPLVAAFGVDALKVVMALAAKNIGGGLNFVAVAGALGLSPAPLAAALAADNVMALVYFPLCSYLGRNEPDPYAGEAQAEAEAAAAAAAGGGGEVAKAGDAEAEADEDEASVSRLGSALALGVAAVALSRRLCPVAGYDLPVATALAVAAATAFPAALAPLTPAAEKLGTLALYLFFSTAGWIGGDLGTILGGGPLLLAFLLLLYFVHLGVVLGLGALVRAARRACAAPPAAKGDLCDAFLERAPVLPLSLLLTASNANIGGPATACALAVGCGWEGLKTPALLVGNLGYAVATPLIFVLYRLLGG